ncbi:MAG: DUF3604 domain-containing protein, partial [Bradymonadaceae bacterium]
GVVAGTDTHLSTPGQVDEADWSGHATGNTSPRARLTGDGDRNIPASRSPGGLTGVWAVENSRDAIFEALRRQETFATSGPRIPVRLFGGWNLPDEMCDQPGFAESGYERGVPMGGELTARES